MRRPIGFRPVVPFQGIASLLVVALLLGLAGRTRLGADPEVAKFLLAQAKKAISTRKFDVAVTKLQRIPTEDPELLEAWYLLGQTFEKMKEPGKALGAYRSFRDACRKKGAALDKKLQRLRKRAEKRIGILGKSEQELLKLQRAFGTLMLGFAQRTQSDDEDIAVDALRRLLSVDPQHEAARKMLDELVGSDDLTSAGGDIDPEAVPIAGIKVWDDLLTRRAIPPGNSTSYKRKILKFDNEGGTIYWTDPFKRAPETFVYEMDFRFAKEYANGFLLGLAFGRDDEAARKGSTDCVFAICQKSGLTLAHASGGQNIEVGMTALKSVPLGTWRRLTVAVEGRKVRVFLDGKQLLNASVPGRKNLTGPIGVFHQRCVAEIRMLRLGTMK